MFFWSTETIISCCGGMASLVVVGIPAVEWAASVVARAKDVAYAPLMDRSGCLDIEYLSSNRPSHLFCMPFVWHSKVVKDWHLE